MNKIKIYTFLLLVSTANFVLAQNNIQQKREQVKAQKVAFITDKLNLDAEAAQKFWPIYNEYMDEKETISNKKRELMQNMSDNQNSLSEEEFEKMGDEFIDLNLKESELAKEYHYKYKEALTPSQILKLYKAENQFKQFLIKQIRERQGMQPRRKN